MKPCLLNVWAQTKAETSRICLETTVPPGRLDLTLYSIPTEKGCQLRLSLHGLALQMASDVILVADGLLHKIRVFEDAPDSAGGTRSGGTSGTVGGGHSVNDPVEAAAVDVWLEHRSEPTINQVPGLPHLIILDFPRDSLRAVFSGRTVAIDPGHGGQDAGIRGPVNLLEKDVALDIARTLASMLKQSGAGILMSRENDSDVQSRAWAASLAAARPDAVVEIHASSSPDPLARQYHAYARTRCGVSKLMAESMRGALNEMMGLAIDEVETMDFASVPLWPTVRLAPFCLTHFADEANLRAPLFKRKIAQSIFNGLSRFFCLTQQGGEVRD